MVSVSIWQLTLSSLTRAQFRVEAGRTGILAYVAVGLSGPECSGVDVEFRI